MWSNSYVSCVFKINQTGPWSLILDETSPNAPKLKNQPRNWVEGSLILTNTYTFYWSKKLTLSLHGKLNPLKVPHWRIKTNIWIWFIKVEFLYSCWTGSMCLDLKSPFFLLYFPACPFYQWLFHQSVCCTPTFARVWKVNENDFMQTQIEDSLVNSLLNNKLLQIFDIQISLLNFQVDRFWMLCKQT